MIKKLIVAGTFAGSILVGVPAANANSPAICLHQYNSAMALCGESITSSCAQYANITYNQCLQKLVEEHN